MSYPNIPKWKYTQVPNLLGGLNLDTKPDMLSDNQAVQLDGVISKAGGIATDTGYVPFNQAVVGLPQATYEFLRQNLIVNLMLITTKTVYKHDASFNKWQLVQGTAATTATVSAGTGAFSIAVASTAGFVNGDLIGVTLDNGDQLQTTANVSGSNLVMTNAVPAGRNILIGAIVVRAPALNGNVDNQVNPVTMSGSDWMVFTNNIDPVQYYDGTHCVTVPNLPGGGNTTCVAVAVYNSALFLLGTTEAGQVFAQRVRRSNQTDPTNWTTGTSGFDDLRDTADKIVAGDILGPYLIVYRDRSIVRGTFIGTGGLNYFFETMIVGEGAVSAGAIIPTGDNHLFVGHTNVYEYYGDYTINPVGDNIFYLAFGFTSNMNPQYRQRLFAFYVEELDEVWILYASTTSTTGYCDTVLRYNVGEKFWYSRKFNDVLIGFGYFSKANSTTWLDLVGTWTQQTWLWNSRTSLANTDIIHLCAPLTNRVYAYDYSTALDNGVAIAYTAESKDFTMGDAKFRFDMIEMFIKGTNILFQYSIDSGYSWTTLTTITQNPQDRVRLYAQFITNRVRFRWSGSSPDFALEWFGFSYKVESLY